MFPGVPIEGQFTVREWNEKIGQYPVSWKYYVQGVVALPRRKST